MEIRIISRLKYSLAAYIISIDGKIIVLDSKNIFFFKIKFCYSAS